MVGDASDVSSFSISMILRLIMHIVRLPGPPLSQCAIEKLLEHGVIVGLGTPLADKAASTRFDAAWVWIIIHILCLHWHSDEGNSLS